MIWKPDTCDCEFSFDFVSGVPLNIRNAVTCPLHEGLSNPTSRLDTIWDENRRKNYCKDEILNRVPAAFTALDESGNRFLKRFDLSWSGEAPNRVLTISIDVSGAVLTPQQISTVQNFINNRGSGQFSGRVFIQ